MLLISSISCLNTVQCSMSTYHRIQPGSITSVCYVSNLTLIEEQTKKSLQKKNKTGMKNMLMFLNVGLGRSMSMFMYEWNLKI